MARLSNAFHAAPKILARRLLKEMGKDTPDIARCLMLVDRGAAFTVEGEDWSDSVLPVAAFYGLLPVVQKLVEKSARLGAKIDKNTALYLAANRPHPAIVRFLVEAGADINGRCLNGETPLMTLCRRSNLDNGLKEETILFLIEKGADAIGIKTEMLTNEGRPTGIFMNALEMAEAHLDYPATRRMVADALAAAGKPLPVPVRKQQRMLNL